MNQSWLRTLQVSMDLEQKSPNIYWLPDQLFLMQLILHASHVRTGATSQVLWPVTLEAAAEQNLPLIEILK